jgi:hypothetical protein
VIDISVPGGRLLENVVVHLMDNVLPAAADYEAAERALSQAFATDQTASHWEAAAKLAKRRASELAIAIDGLTDRTSVEMRLSKAEIRRRVTNLCLWPGSLTPRLESLERIRGVACAYRHANLTDPTLPISSEADVLVVGLGYGLDGFGVGKFSGVEVIVREKPGASWKFLGNAPVAVAAWFRFLSREGAVLPSGPHQMCNLQIHPDIPTP